MIAILGILGVLFAVAAVVDIRARRRRHRITVSDGDAWRGKQEHLGRMAQHGSLDQPRGDVGGLGGFGG
jgi:hypothetical protein